MRNDPEARERGTAALLVAASLLLIMAIATVALDGAAGFNQRRADQNAADLAALAAATHGFSEADAVESALETARSNLGIAYTDAQWQTLWQTCTDVGRPSDFSPVDDPWDSDPSVKLQCISAGIGDSGESEIRVRIPDQQTSTVFGRMIGVQSLTTRASAHGGFRLTAVGNALPFGILYGTPMGTEQCVVQPPGGHAVGACDGPSSGNFGGVELPLWSSKEKQTTVDCTPGGWELSVNIAIGSDHTIAPASGTSDLSGDGRVDSYDYPGTGGVHPGDADIVSNGTPRGRASKLDACSSLSGEAVATDAVPAFPLNTVDVDTGFSGSDVKLGIIGAPDSKDPVFPGNVPPRLRQVVNSHTIDVSEKDGPDNETYTVDNTPLWDYLRDRSDLSSDLVPLTGFGEACDRGWLNTQPFTVARTAFMTGCLPTYVAWASVQVAPPPLFGEDVGDNPRFAWAPMFHFTTWGSGNGWQPIHSFVAVYLDGVWFNCNGSGNGTLNEDCGGKRGLEFYPGELTDGTTHTGKNGGGALNLRLDQMTAITIPTYALPESVAAHYPGQRGPFTTGLLR